MFVGVDQERNVAVARRYMEALERREPAEMIAGYLHPEMVQEEFPNRLNPHGGRSDHATMLTRLVRGREVMASERYEVESVVALCERVDLEVRWSGTLAISLGEQLPAGLTMRARFGVFLDFRAGQIIAQRNYDCFEPW